MKKSIAVLGLGKYGCSVAESLYNIGEDVLVADKNEQIIRDMSSKVTSAICCNLENEDEVMSLGLQNMDIVITGMGGNIAASIMVVSIAKEKGVRTVIAKASSPRMAKILERVGADKIINPEQEGGIRSARILASQSIHDYYELDEDLCMVELQPRPSWIGKSLMELNVRQKYNMNVAAIKEKGENWGYVSPTKKLTEKNLLMVIIDKKDISKWK
ncbi:potassium channel family protein [Butyrivibrio sp. INlla21]|uniref:potassium channel family protein n=1 Tax=Butyrivibrio sp. INlla21 TaxID=1520811 RepID=UPI0008E85450|nr:TrkA family potassium uptake protein [Butyrivibrio sp. INlla21]SFV00956.1 trk system potassium uptake protein TrkA [Butyrivibrio sp. INlla21]